LALSERNLARREELLPSGGVSKEDRDLAQFTRDQDRQRVAQLQADLETAHLGSRKGQIAAAEANVRALEAALAKAEWDLSQKRQSAPQSGLVYDTLFRQGEWIAAGRSVVVLLPPENIKVRAFVPETRMGAIQAGQKVRVHVDGIAEPFLGKVTYISPQAEYTPPSFTAGRAAANWSSWSNCTLILRRPPGCILASRLMWTLGLNHDAPAGD
jgi:HlyD family secretion protein